MEFRRRLYPRGGSFETTVPKPLLFQMEAGKKYDVVFSYDAGKGAWYIRLEERRDRE